MKNLLIFAFLFFYLPLSNLIAQEINDTFGVDLAERHISITTGFNGADLLIFGAISRGKVILTIEGTDQSYRVRKKSRVGGIWINNEQRTIKDIPSFYVVATSRGAFDDLDYPTRLEKNIGFDTMNESLSVFDVHGRRFYDSLIDIKTQQNMYQSLKNSIEISPSGLFRVNVKIPASVPPGNYSVRAVSVEDGKIIQSYQTALSINKVGFGAQIYNLAHQYPKIYGVIAIIISVLSGLLANFVFNRRKP